METREHYRVIKGPSALHCIGRLASLLVGDRREITLYLEQEQGAEPIAVKGILAGLVVGDIRVHPTCMLADVLVERQGTWPLQVKGYNISAGKGGIVVVDKGWTPIVGVKRHDGDGIDPFAFESI